MACVFVLAAKVTRLAMSCVIGGKAGHSLRVFVRAAAQLARLCVCMASQPCVARLCVCAVGGCVFVLAAAQVARLASLHGIVLRSGCFCNPGACAKYLGLTGNALCTAIAIAHLSCFILILASATLAPAPSTYVSQM